MRSLLKEDRVFSKSDVSVAEQSLEKNISLAKESLEILNNYVKEDKSLLSALAGREELPVKRMIPLRKNTSLRLILQSV